MNKIFKIIVLTAITLYSLIIFIRSISFGLLKKPDNSFFENGTFLTMIFAELSLLLFIIYFSTFGKISKNNASFFLLFNIVNLIYLLCATLITPIFIVNLTDQGNQPIFNPMLGISILYCITLIYLNIQYRKEDFISLFYSRILYLFFIIFSIAILTIRISFANDIEKIMNFQG